MKNLLFPALLALAAGCGSAETKTGDSIAKDTQPAAKVDTPAVKNKTPRVTGIGGIFFKCKDPKAMREWYGKHFSMPTNEYGAMFEFRNTDDPGEKGYLQWSPFSEKTKYFAPSTKEFMINYRVEGIEALVEQLKKDGVTVLDSIASYHYGKFVHLVDPEGNKIELWEPVDDGFGREYTDSTVH